jgi:hypothetical protein
MAFHQPTARTNPAVEMAIVNCIEGSFLLQQEKEEELTAGSGIAGKQETHL